jgi:hypothetical protein
MPTLFSGGSFFVSDVVRACLACMCVCLILTFGVNQAKELFADETFVSNFMFSSR